MEISEKDWVNEHFPNLCQPKPLEKDNNGSLGIIGGASGMTGDPILVGNAGLKIGARKVLIGFSQERLPIGVLPEMPELKLLTANRLLLNGDLVSAWVFGSGLGEYSLAKNLFDKILTFKDAPVILDGCALIQLSRRKWKAEAGQVVILTPYEKEAAMLLGITLEEVQARRAETILTIAQKYQTLVVLRGQESLVATPKHIVWKNQSDHQQLTNVGMGHILSGIIGGLLAQGLPLFEAICGGVWLHGRAIDSLKKRGIGPIGVLSSELSDEVRLIRNYLIHT